MTEDNEKLLKLLSRKLPWTTIAVLLIIIIAMLRGGGEAAGYYADTIIGRLAVLETIDPRLKATEAKIESLQQQNDKIYALVTALVGNGHKKD